MDRQERIVDIPHVEVNSFCDDFHREGATSVHVLRQPHNDGYTVVACFPQILNDNKLLLRAVMFGVVSFEVYTLYNYTTTYICIRAGGIQHSVAVDDEGLPLLTDSIRKYLVFVNNFLRGY